MLEIEFSFAGFETGAEGIVTVREFGICEIARGLNWRYKRRHFLLLSYLLPSERAM
jgi:hypothetical protein